jgi:hypothetical protein
MKGGQTPFVHVEASHAVPAPTVIPLGPITRLARKASSLRVVGRNQNTRQGGAELRGLRMQFQPERPNDFQHRGEFGISFRWEFPS